MDTIILSVIVVIVGLCLLIYVILKSAAGPSSAPSQAKSAEQKRAEIIRSYKERMEEALSHYLDDKETLQAKKTQLLREFSAEFSRNVFFDADEIRDIISELAHYPLYKQP